MPENAPTGGATIRHPGRGDFMNSAAIVPQSCDVAVIGGGAAGLAAAVAAARAGARTCLIERAGALGGMASLSLVHSICGLYRLSDTPQRDPANPGFAAEFAHRLLHAGGAWGPVRLGRVDVLLQSPPTFATLCDQFVRESPSLTVALHTEVTALRGDRCIREVDTLCRGVARRIEPRVVIDASGDGLTAALFRIGYEQTPADHLQRPAFIFTLGSVEPDTLHGDARLQLAGQIAAAVRDGELSPAACGAALRPTQNRGEVYITLDLDMPQYDPTDLQCLAALEQHGRSLATELARWLRGRVAGFGESYIAAWPGRVGIRESRRLRGEYRIETDDLLTGATFDDSIGLATWPLELRETPRGPRLKYPIDNRPCEIPLRALRAIDADNLWIAGRCISCSHEAQASLRVIGTCLVTGEAAGLAAARMAQRSARGESDSHRLPTDAHDVIEARRDIGRARAVAAESDRG